MRPLLIVAGLWAVFAVTACAHHLVPRQGAAVPTAAPQVTSQCLRDRVFPGCQETCALHPDVIWCWAPR